MPYLLFLLVFIFIVTAIVLGIVHVGFKAPRNREQGSPADFNVDFTEVTIPTINNKSLFGWFLVTKNSAETIIVLHGWGGNAELMLPMALPFYRAGLNVLLIDTRSHGNSDPDTFSSMPRFAEDLDASIHWLKQNHPDRVDKVALLGHSVGAAAVLLASSRRQDLHAVISVSAFAHPEWMMQRHLSKIHMPRFIVLLIFRYIEWVIGHKLKNIAPLNTVCNINFPILLVHGKADTTVPVEDARAILANCPNENISLLEIEGAGHDSVDKIEQHSDSLIKFLKTSGFNFSYD